MQNEYSNDNKEYCSIILNHIYYFESHRRGVNASLEKSFVPVPDSLGSLSNMFSNKGFIRISKWCIVNINHIVDFRVRINSQIDLILDNKSIVTVNRAYLRDFRKFLKKGMKT